MNSILRTYHRHCRQLAAEYLRLHDQLQASDPPLARFALLRAQDNLHNAEPHGVPASAGSPFQDTTDYAHD